jgi:protein-L-isoaspartate(D-aspartate) O-methyltransferase
LTNIFRQSRERAISGKVGTYDARHPFPNKREPTMQDRSANLREFFARYVTALGEVGEVRDPRIEQAFATVKREPFVGPGPWSINLPGVGYLKTPDDDLAFIYQDTLVALDAARGINIGRPSAHAGWLDALELREGESVIQVGAGVGYYTAVIAQLVGPTGQVHAFEIDQTLAARARSNLKHLSWVKVQNRSGVDDIPAADAVYVNAAITQPSSAWSDALRTNGRLIFPLHAVGAVGGMLFIKRPVHGRIWPARFLSGAAFMSLTGPQDAHAGLRLNEAFASGGADAVRSFRTDDPIDDTCWFRGDGWWLSTAPPEEES